MNSKSLDCLPTLAWSKEIGVHPGEIGIRDWIGPRCLVKVQFIDGVRDWKGWLQAAPCSYAGGFKEDASGLHAYIMMRRQGIVFHLSEFPTSTSLWPSMWVWYFKSLNSRVTYFSGHIVLRNLPWRYSTEPEHCCRRARCTVGITSPRRDYVVETVRVRWKTDPGQAFNTYYSVWVWDVHASEVQKCLERFPWQVNHGSPT